MPISNPGDSTGSASQWKMEFSSDGVTWHEEPQLPGERYFRMANPSGSTAHVDIEAADPLANPVAATTVNEGQTAQLDSLPLEQWENSFWYYVISNGGTVKRAGILNCVWNSSGAVGVSDTSTDDVGGSTEAVRLYATPIEGNMTLQVSVNTGGGNGWDVKAFREAIKKST